jgi:hypothetical protein
VRGKIDSSHVFSADGVSVAWYADEGYTTLYDFDEAVTSDLIIYGKVTDTGRYVRSNGYGWDVQSGKVYAGDAVKNNYITTDYYISPTYTDVKTASASFSFSSTKYAVYTRGLDVTKPFTVTLDFDYAEDADMSSAWFEYSVFPSLTLAQAAGSTTWGNTGAASVMMFNLGTQTLAGLTTGTTWVNAVSSTDLTANADAFKSLFDGGNTKIVLTAEITDTGTTFSSGDTVVATSPASRSNFPTGYAYLNFGSYTGKSFDVDISVSQESGALTATADSGATVGELSLSGMIVTLPIEVKSGYELQSIKVGDIDVAHTKVRGSENVYALDLPVWGQDAEIKITTKETETAGSSSADGSSNEEAASKKGCGGEIAPITLLAFGAAVVVFVAGKIRKKEEKR